MLYRLSYQLYRHRQGRIAMTQISGAACLVTGAASGIGKALARELVAGGCDVALADRDVAGLKALAGELEVLTDRKVSVHAVDVADRGQMEALAEEVVSTHPTLNLLINNAGVALFGQFHEIELADMEWLISINFWGVVYGTRFLLPHLIRQREAHIVNLSSIFGIIAPPGQTAYCAAKFAVRGLSEALRHELDMMRSPVRLSVVHPGGVATSIARNSRVGARVQDNRERVEMVEHFERLAETTPQTAARRIVRGIERNEPRILIGADARRADLVQRLLPASYWKVIARSLERTLRRSKPGGA
jgi:short-subunit dehydrogenase